MGTLILVAFLKKNITKVLLPGVSVAFARGIQKCVNGSGQVALERIRVIAGRDSDPAATCLAQLARHAPTLINTIHKPPDRRIITPDPR